MPLSARPGCGLALFACAVWLSGCAAEPQPGEGGAIRGAWRWIGSSGGIVGISPSPDTEGLGLIFFFHRDDRLSVYQDGAMVAAIGFVPGYARPDSASSSTRVLEYTNPLTVFPFDPGIERHFVRRVGRDTLVLSDPCCRRYEHALVRIE